MDTEERSASWRNWAGTQLCAQVSMERPRTEVELWRTVREAAVAGGRVKAAGAGHSVTGIYDD